MQASSAISFRLPPASISAAASSGSPLTFRFRFLPFSRLDFPRPIVASHQLSDPRCFRFLSSASVLGSDYSASVSSVPSSSRLRLTLLPGARFPSRFPVFSLHPTWFPMPTSGNQYLALCLFPFALPCFAPTAAHQVLVPLSLPVFPFPSGSFRPLPVPSQLLSFLFLPFPLLPGVASHCLPVLSSPLGSLSSPSPAFFRPPVSGYSVLGTLLVSFRPTLLRSRSRSTGDDRHFRIWSLSMTVRFLSSSSGFRR